MTAKQTANNYRLLIVDDDDDVLLLLTKWLSAEGFTIQTAKSGEEALDMIASYSPQLVLTDLYMKKMTGMQLLSKIHTANPLLPVIMLSGQAQIPDAIKATHLGCSAFLTKPIQKEELLKQVHRTLSLTAANVFANEFGHKIIYRSKKMEDLLEIAAAVADTNVTVFISGATGTGKEVIAKAIHDASSRRDNPFIAVNCGAIPEQLLESELFGHEKGAFTGANTRHEGLFQAANSGTVFLDEVGDMPLPLQVKLLRVLQDLEVRPVGSTQTYPVDVRIISATHQDLEKLVKDGEFREDLYYRLKVVPLAMPRLAERPEDISLLTEYFLEENAQQNHQKKKHFAPAAMDYLMASSWPGNIRQLINVVDLCATLCKTNTISLNLTKKALQDKPQVMQTLKEVKQSCERDYLLSVLRITGGHVANSARIAGRNRTEFYKLLSQHKINPAQFRTEDRQ